MLGDAIGGREGAIKDNSGWKVDGNDFAVVC